MNTHFIEMDNLWNHLRTQNGKDSFYDRAAIEWLQKGAEVWNLHKRTGAKCQQNQQINTLPIIRIAAHFKWMALLPIIFCVIGSVLRFSSVSLAI